MSVAIRFICPISFSLLPQVWRSNYLNTTCRERFIPPRAGAAQGSQFVKLALEPKRWASGGRKSVSNQVTVAESPSRQLPTHEKGDPAQRSCVPVR